jgi:hypothetical protein
MNQSTLLINTFIVTSLYDVLLRFMSEDYDKLPFFIQEYKFIEYLIPYFKKHTLLAAALIAGFIGATTQFIIINIQKFPTNICHQKEIMIFLCITFIISALYGFVMKATKLFPHLEETYYKKLGTIKSMIHDGVSGLIVQITLLFFYLYIK